MVERLTFSGVDYTLSDFETGIEWARKELAGLIEDAKKPGQVGEIASSIIPGYQAAVGWAETQTPQQIFGLWGQITKRVEECSKQNLDKPEIGRTITEEFGEAPIHIRVLLRNMSGPHKTLGQWIYAYLLNRMLGGAEQNRGRKK